MSKRDDLIAIYAGDLRDKCGVTPDMALLTKVTIGLGPAIYTRDASTVAGTQASELETHPHELPDQEARPHRRPGARGRHRQGDRDLRPVEPQQAPRGRLLPPDPALRPRVGLRLTPSAATIDVEIRRAPAPGSGPKATRAQAAGLEAQAATARRRRPAQPVHHALRIAQHAPSGRRRPAAPGTAGRPGGSRRRGCGTPRRPSSRPGSTASPVSSRTSRAQVVVQARAALGAAAGRAPEVALLAGIGVDEEQPPCVER